jgi:hypothetical protein
VEKEGGQLDDIVLVKLPDLCPKLIICERDDNASVDHAAIIGPNYLFVVEDQAKHFAAGLLPMAPGSDRRRLLSELPQRRDRFPDCLALRFAGFEEFPLAGMIVIEAIPDRDTPPAGA